MLSPSFIDWWFAPWAYATRGSFPLPETDELGRRDGYRLWCRQAGIPPDLPSVFHEEWHVAAMDREEDLLSSAMLFGGLIAVRLADQAWLGQLSAKERAWCLKIAGTQPLKAASASSTMHDEGIAAFGLLELARRLKAQFPGMWPRLSCLVPRQTAELVNARLRESLAMEEPIETSAVRAARCWAMCQARAVESRQAPSSAVASARQTRLAPGMTQ